MDIQNNTPVNSDGLSLLWKIFIWIVVWFMFSALVFIMVMWLSTSIDQAVSNSANNIKYSPLLWLSFLAIASLISIIWTIVIAWIYNIVRNEDYYDMKIMSSSILAVNLLLLIPFLLLYWYVWTTSNIWTIFIVYGFHLFFSIYVSLTCIDVIKNPNYSIVYIVWNGFGFILVLLIFFIIYSFYSSVKSWTDQKNILLFPPILAFSLIPFISWVFEKAYYKLYEMWNDIFYVPSLSEVMVDEEEIDDVNVDIQ